MFDYEIDSISYTVTVSVSDGMDSYGNADTAGDSSIDVAINVTDLNEPPQFADAAATTLEVSEDTTIGVGIGEYAATDPDAGDTVTYSVSGTDAATVPGGPPMVNYRSKRLSTLRTRAASPLSYPGHRQQRTIAGGTEHHT